MASITDKAAMLIDEPGLGVMIASASALHRWHCVIARYTDGIVPSRVIQIGKGYRDTVNAALTAGKQSILGVVGRIGEPKGLSAPPQLSILAATLQATCVANVTH